jgi:hypothetical protein
VILVPDRTTGKFMGLKRQTVVTTAIMESIAHCVVGGKDMGSKRQNYGSSLKNSRFQFLFLYFVSFITIFHVFGSKNPCQAQKQRNPLPRNHIRVAF